MRATTWRHLRGWWYRCNDGSCAGCGDSVCLGRTFRYAPAVPWSLCEFSCGWSSVVVLGLRFTGRVGILMDICSMPRRLV